MSISVSRPTPVDELTHFARRGDALTVRLFMGADEPEPWKVDALLKSFTRAVCSGELVVVDTLLTAQGDLIKKGTHSMVVEPLSASAALNHADVARVLLRHGANPNAMSGVHRRTPLMQCAISTIRGDEGNVETARVLLEFGAELDARDTHEQTALMIAASRCRFELVRLLLHRGAQTDLLDADSRTACQLAVIAGDQESAALIAQHAAERALALFGIQSVACPSA